MMSITEFTASAKEQDSNISSPITGTSSDLDSPATEDIIPSLPSPPSKIEAEHYYDGLYSRPILVARSSTIPWKLPTDPEEVKELRPIGNHAIRDAWEGELAQKIFAYLDSMKVKWTSIDLVRIGIAEQRSFLPVVWIGVKPSTLSGHDGVKVVLKCKEILVEHDITDVDVEIRESEVIRY
ncbi:hypothetical protein VNI00_014299 [Paramarasmius palmivorus]|uniref:Uncharacterized protein n=1 Tax=Paramarasmius palmivorus TaxID=297713 RepID=A0AAW0BU96_9AGAR